MIEARADHLDGHQLPSALRREGQRFSRPPLRDQRVFALTYVFPEPLQGNLMKMEEDERLKAGSMAHRGDSLIKARADNLDGRRMRVSDFLGYLETRRRSRINLHVSRTCAGEQPNENGGGAGNGGTAGRGFDGASRRELSGEVEDMIDIAGDLGRAQSKTISVESS